MLFFFQCITSSSISLYYAAIGRDRNNCLACSLLYLSIITIIIIITLEYGATGGAALISIGSGRK